MINKYTGMLLIILASIQSYAQSINSSVLDAEDRYRQNSWVDSVYNQMTLKEKVGQLIIVFTDSKPSEEEPERIESLIND